MQLMYHAFLIKYAEIAIKGKNRPIFEDALVVVADQYDMIETCGAVSADVRHWVRSPFLKLLNAGQNCRIAVKRCRNSRQYQ